MAKFEELIESRSATDSVDGESTGTREFVRRDNSTSPSALDSLPSYYSRFPNGYSNVVLRLKDITTGHHGANEDVKKYTCNYVEDVDGDEAGDRELTEESTRRTMRMGGKMLTIKPDGYVWDGTEDALDSSIRLYVKQSSGTVSLYSEVSLSRYARYVTNAVAMSGMVNSDTWLGFAPGIIRFDSFDADEFRRPNTFGSGSIRYWKIRLHFAYVIQKGNDKNDDAGVFGWNYFHDPEPNQYRKTDPLVYEETSQFRQLVTSVE